MNHFRVAPGRDAEFERRWRERESHLSDVPGFVQFHLVRGKDHQDGSHRYASHVIWDSHAAFHAWTQSEAFRKAHAQGGLSQGVLLEHPRFMGWQSVDLG